MGNQCNIYLSSALLAELEAEAKAHPHKNFSFPVMTPQAMLRLAWELRPKSLRRATASKKAGK